MREKIREGLSEFTPDERGQVHLIFTAHSLPKSIVEQDPYVKEMEESVGKVLEGMDPFPGISLFRVEGAGPRSGWVPKLSRFCLELSREKVRGVLIVPIGFVSDHIEILYDIDIAFRQKAQSLGMVLKRTHSLNSSERFIEALADAVERHIREGVKESNSSCGMSECGRSE